MPVIIGTEIPEIQSRLGHQRFFPMLQKDGAANRMIADSKELNSGRQKSGDPFAAFRDNTDCPAGIHEAHFGYKIVGTAEDMRSESCHAAENVGDIYVIHRGVCGDDKEFILQIRDLKCAIFR